MDAPRYCYRHPDRETGLSCSECGRPICYECMTPAPVGLRCPEHSGKPQGVRKVTRPMQQAVTGVGSNRVNAVTMTLIGINVAVFVAELAVGGTINGQGNWIYRHGALFASGVYFGGGVFPAPPGAGGLATVGVAHGEWWRLITAAFLHGGVLHLGINMLVLWWFGPPLEEYLGRARFIGLYLAACLAGSAGALLQAPLAPTVGASGAFFGILGAMAILEWQATGRVGGNVAALIAINLALSFAIPNVSWGGHVGGLIGGVLVMLAYSHWGKGHAAYGRLGLAGILGVVLVSAGSVAIAYWKVRGLA